MSQLKQLAQRFEPKYIEKKPGNRGGAYVTHSVVTERLLEIVGPFDFELVQVIRGEAPEIKTSSKTYPTRENAIVGVVARLTATIDGATHSIEEVGSEDNPAMNTDAANLKNSMSDALKRCAMRFGLGLHLWSQEMYGLDKATPDSPEEEAAKRTARAERLAAALKKFRAGDPVGYANLILDREVKSLEELSKEEANDVLNSAHEAWQKERAEADGQPEEEVPA